MIVEPIVQVNEAASPPTGSWLGRALRAVFVERRVPYQVERRINRLCKAAGFRFKKVSKNGVTLTLRRLTQDEQFVERVLFGDDYVRDGFEIRESDTVVDIGGNIGAFALRAAQLASTGHVFTYEPQAENFALLQKNISRNRFTNITACRTAIGGRSGTVRLFTGGDTGLHSTSAARGVHESKYEDVPCVTLEQVFETNRIAQCDFLKVDCEGAEYDILHNTPAAILARIDKIAMEYHRTGSEQKRTLSDGLVKLLQDHGFQIVDYIDFADYDCGFIRARKSS